jgi:FHS family L-fucose permease-like MFS transporter
MANLPLQNIRVSDSASAAGVSYTPALISLAVLYFMMGFITCLNDTLVPLFKEGFVLNYAQSSLVQFYFFATYGLMSIPAGRIVEKVGYKKGMVFGFSIAAIGALLFYPASVSNQYGVFLAALFVIALGMVLLQVAANPYITVLGPAKTASSRLALIQGVGSIGTTVAPIFGASVILGSVGNTTASGETLQVPYLLIGATLFVIAVVVSRLHLPVIEIAKTDREHQGTHSVFAFRNLNFGIIAVFMYVGAEVAVGTFLTNYVIDTLQIEAVLANHYVAFYWGSMLVGRLAGSWILKFVKPAVVLAALSVLAVLFISISILTTGYLAVWTMVAVGLCNSVMFAIIFSLSLKGLENHSSKASGLLSSAIIGGALVSYAQGYVKDQESWQVAFLIPLVCYLYILFYSINGYRSRVSAR